MNVYCAVRQQSAGLYCNVNAIPRLFFFFGVVYYITQVGGFAIVPLSYIPFAPFFILFFFFFHFGFHDERNGTDRVVLPSTNERKVEGKKEKKKKIFSDKRL